MFCYYGCAILIIKLHASEVLALTWLPKWKQLTSFLLIENREYKSNAEKQREKETKLENTSKVHVWLQDEEWIFHFEPSP